MCQAPDRYTAFSHSSIYFLKVPLANDGKSIHTNKAEDYIHLILQQGSSYTFISSSPAYNGQKKFVKYHTFFFVFYFLDDANKERKDFRHLRWCHFSHFSPTVHAVSVCQCYIKEEKPKLSLIFSFLCNISRHQDQCKSILPPQKQIDKLTIKK